MLQNSSTGKIKRPALMRALRTHNPVDVCAQLALAVLLYAVTRNTIADRAAKGYATDSSVSTMAGSVGAAVDTVAGASVAVTGASVAGASVVGGASVVVTGQSSGNGGA